MDARAILASQGWRGAGHSLHAKDDAIGLAKPLLVSRKDNTKGLGTKQHFTSDQWWMNAFDEQLRGLDTTHEGRVSQTVTTGQLNRLDRASLGKYHLYSSFVPGGLLGGTIGRPPEKLPEPAAASKTDKEARRQRKLDRAAKRAADKRQASVQRVGKEKEAPAPDRSPDDDDRRRRRRERKEEKRRRRKERESTTG